MEFITETLSPLKQNPQALEEAREEFCTHQKLWRPPIAPLGLMGTQDAQAVWASQAGSIRIELYGWAGRGPQASPPGSLIRFQAKLQPSPLGLHQGRIGVPRPAQFSVACDYLCSAGRVVILGVCLGG